MYHSSKVSLLKAGICLYRDLTLTQFFQSYLSFVSAESAFQGKEVKGENTKLIREASIGKNIT